MKVMKPLMLALFLLGCLPWALGEKRLVLIDQDGSGPGGSNQMSMMVLLQSPDAEVLGITVVTGNAWRDEEVQHTWTAQFKPDTDVQLVHAQVDLDLSKFTNMFVNLMKGRSDRHLYD